MRKLTVPQRTAANAIGAGLTLKRAAEEAGVDESTVWRWMNGADDLSRAMNAVIAEVADDALAQLMGAATGALAKHVNDPNPDTAVKAADVIFRRKAQVEKRDHGFRQLELQREALTAKQADESSAPTGVIVLPQEDAP
jgi:transcriptional regulator with XRE-family HTH domain